MELRHTWTKHNWNRTFQLHDFWMTWTFRFKFWKNFKISHDFFISKWILLYTLKQHHSIGFLLMYTFVTWTFIWPLPWGSNFIFKEIDIGNNFQISEWIYFILGHNICWEQEFSTDLYFYDLDLWMTLVFIVLYHIFCDRCVLRGY